MRNFIPFTSDDEVVSIAHGFVNRTLPKHEFTHAAHFATAIWLFVRRPDIDPFREMPNLIRAYNESVGGANTDTSGYHETITQASLRAARAFLSERPDTPLFSLCNELMRSPVGEPSWLLAYWSRPRLFSVEARRTWVDPDLQAFPF